MALCGFQNMNLYSIFIHFSDHTNGIEQQLAECPHTALIQCLKVAKSLTEYDSEKLLKFAGEPDRLVHVANGLKGVWIWNPILDDEFDNILGGYIIQTDFQGALRTTT